MKSKWLIAIVVTSIALNLALLGYLAGRHSSPFPHADPTRGFPRWALTLPDERRLDLRGTLRRPELRQQLRALRRHHRALHDAVVADPYDPHALAAALENMRGELAALELSNHASFQEFVSRLTPAERRELAAHLKRPRLPPRRHPGAVHPPGAEHPQ